ncbi:unnamed protein product [Linum trigynum]|uniref:Uncharacterized protein n=1 Tax=Linum trigynum TaxID=586398 RepID=A0AAV2GC19_9ROSI
MQIRLSSGKLQLRRTETHPAASTATNREDKESIVVLGDRSLTSSMGGLTNLRGGGRREGEREGASVAQWQRADDSDACTSSDEAGGEAACTMESDDEGKQAVD